MLNAIIKSLIGSAPAPSPPVTAPAASPPPAPVPMPVDTPATIPDFSAGTPGSPSEARQPQAEEPAATGAPASTPRSVPLAFRPDPSIRPDAGASGSVPLSFRPDPSIRADADAARAHAIESQRQLWIASIVQRVGAPAPRPTLLAGAAPAAETEPGKPEAA